MHSPEIREDRRRKQRGAAMIEMALVLPVYFLLVYGVLEMCFIMFGYCNATYACRQAARYAAVHGTGSTYQCTLADVQNVAKTYLWGTPTPTITWSPGTPHNPEIYITVNISMVYSTAIPFSKLSQISVGTSAKVWVLQ
jgi:Flp pilus assembly protein TadG